MDTLVVLSNTPHPLDPATRYQPPRVELTISDGPPAAADDRCRLSRPENGARLRADRGLRHGDGAAAMTFQTARELARSARRRPSTSRCPPGEAGPTSSRAARSSASSTSRATRPSTRCSSTPRSSTSATARPTRSARRATSTSRPGTRLMSSEGNAAADDRRRHLRPARHARRRLLGREQPGALRARQEVHAQLPRQLPAGAGAVRARHDQARPAQQHQLLHERARHARRRADVRGRRLRRPAATSRCAPRWTCWC